MESEFIKYFYVDLSDPELTWNLAILIAIIILFIILMNLSNKKYIRPDDLKFNIDPSSLI